MLGAQIYRLAGMWPEEDDGCNLASACEKGPIRISWPRAGTLAPPRSRKHLQKVPQKAAMATSTAPGNAAGHPMPGLAGKRALVTGARKGLGRGIALSLARAGCAAVAIVDVIDDEVAAAVVAQISAVEGCTGRLFVADCSNIAEVRKTIDAFAADGGIDILVNNAMIAHAPPCSSQCAPFLSTDEGMWDALTSLGYKGYFFAMQAAARHMVAQRRGGSLLCIGSVHAVNPIAEWAVYSGMKAGLECMVRCLACDLREHNIRSNVIAPGGMANGLPDNPADIDGPTDPSWYEKAEDGSYRWGFDGDGGSDAFKAAVPAGVGGAPSDVGAMVTFLASDLGRYINGQTMRVDGGMSACNVFW